MLSKGDRTRRDHQTPDPNPWTCVVCSTTDDGGELGAGSLGDRVRAQLFEHTANLRDLYVASETSGVRCRRFSGRWTLQLTVLWRMLNFAN